MREPTEREWLEGLLPEQQWEFYHPSCDWCGDSLGDGFRVVDEMVCRSCWREGYAREQMPDG